MLLRTLSDVCGCHCTSTVGLLVYGADDPKLELRTVANIPDSACYHRLSVLGGILSLLVVNNCKGGFLGAFLHSVNLAS